MTTLSIILGFLFIGFVTGIGSFLGQLVASKAMSNIR